MAQQFEQGPAPSQAEFDELNSKITTQLITLTNTYGSVNAYLILPKLLLLYITVNANTAAWTNIISLSVIGVVDCNMDAVLTQTDGTTVGIYANSGASVISLRGKAPTAEARGFMLIKLR